MEYVLSQKIYKDVNKINLHIVHFPILHMRPKYYCTANIFNVIFTVFKCVPFSTVISLYGLHLIAATVE